MKTKRKTVSVLICAAMIILAAAAFPLGLMASRTANYETPETIVFGQAQKVMEFGRYPQSSVTDEATLSALNETELNWTSYGYFSGNIFFGSAQPGDFMEYADTVYNGTSYRAVRLTDYRPYCCHLPNTHTRQYLRAELNKTYWFRFDPIRWIILDEGNGLLMSESVLDCGAFCNTVYVDDPDGKIAMGNNLQSAEYYNDPGQTVYATDYFSSDVRKWLNGTFLGTAFTAEEQTRLLLTPLENRSAERKWKKYDSADCEDRVFLLSYFDITNPAYGFSPQPEEPDPLRQACPTEYALIQGCWAEEDPIAPGAAWWWLRTPSDHSNANCDVSFYGIPSKAAGILPYFPDFTDSGYRPAIRITPTNNADKGS